jgi:hypothetical protein
MLIRLSQYHTVIEKKKKKKFLKNFKMKKFHSTTLFLVSLFLVIYLTNAQSRCYTICDQDKDCKTGKCLLTECKDTEKCFEFCFKCDGIQTCYASG